MKHIPVIEKLCPEKKNFDLQILKFIPEGNIGPLELDNKMNKIFKACLLQETHLQRTAP